MEERETKFSPKLYEKIIEDRDEQIRQLKIEKTALLDFIDGLNRGLAAEIEKDGWCRLAVPADKLEEMQEFFKSMRGEE
jgi:hypothetical protein